MNTSFERELPKELIKDCHTYIVNMFNCSYADFMTNNRKKVINYLQKNNLEITSIKFERNMLGLNDYRLIVRPKSNNGR